MLTELTEVTNQVYVAPEMRAYVLDLVEATRQHPDLLFGASPRAALALLRTSCAFAVTVGRNYVTPDDVKAVAASVLAHRMAVSSSAELGGGSATSLVAELLATVPVPVRAQRATSVAAG
jgi:MoxR-like ATPase